MKGERGKKAGSDPSSHLTQMTEAMCSLLDARQYNPPVRSGKQWNKLMEQKFGIRAFPKLPPDMLMHISRPVQKHSPQF